MLGFSLSPGGLLLPYHLGALASLSYHGFLSREARRLLVIVEELNDFDSLGWGFHNFNLAWRFGTVGKELEKFLARLESIQSVL